jgi:hypothetical protein
MKSRIASAALIIAAIATGMALRTPSPSPSDTCTAGTRAIITSTDARIIMHDPTCPKESTP